MDTQVYSTCKKRLSLHL